jgi:hypothetical protein
MALFLLLKNNLRKLKIKFFYFEKNGYFYNMVIDNKLKKDFKKMKHINTILNRALNSDRAVKIHVVSAPNDVFNFIEKYKNVINVENDNKGFMIISRKPL